MKVGIYGGEAFPVYSVHTNGFAEIEVDEDTLKRWQKVFDSFHEVQCEIVARMKEQGHSDKVWSHNMWYGFCLGDD